MNDEEQSGHLPEMALRILAGLDAGVFASVLLSVWLALLGWTRDSFWWSCFNVAATPFFGDHVYAMGLSAATLAGAATLIVVYGLLGAFVGYWIRPSSFWALAIRVLILTMAWHFFADRFFWPALTPFSRSYFSPRILLPGHLLWGLAMLRYRSRFLTLGGAFGDPALFPQPQVTSTVEDSPELSQAAEHEENTAAPAAEITPPEQETTPGNPPPG